MKKKRRTVLGWMKVRISVIMVVLLCLGASIPAVLLNAQTYSASVARKMYNPTLDTGFGLSDSVSGTVYGSSGYTSLKVYSDDGSISTGTYNGVNAYGISGVNAYLKFKINIKASVDEYLLGSPDWMLCYDSWGRIDGEKVNGVTTGEIGSGALIVQTSYDGKNWSSDNKAKYNNGLYTTDYYAHYGTKEVCIYTPAGSDVSRGIYIRVLYAYEVYDAIACTHENNWWDKLWGASKYKHDNHNEYENYVEAYTLYICNNSTESVTFHNISAEGKLSETSGEGMQTEAIRRAESMKSGSLTVSGFRIDNSLNTAAKVSVLRNGSNYSIPSNKKITETGRYEVNVTTPMGKSSRTVIYVDRSSVSDSLKRYFGSGALNGSKRIYSDGALPVYEGGSTTFHIEKTPANYLSVTGYIKNKTTGAYIYVTGSDDGYDIAITEAGKYEAVLRVDPFENSKAPSGDARIYRFNFEVITEGTAPGPLKNKQQLEKYGISNVSDLRPYYYGVTFPSAGSGDVTVAFADRDSAIEYAYNFEKGVVEDQGNGTFTYKGILSVGTRKKEFSDLWALTDAMYYFAEQAVSLEWFDLSREHTYLTLEDSVLQSVSNLRTLELARSVVIFADAEQKSALAVKDALPVICPKTRAVLALNGETLREKDDFIFIRDKNGYESHTVTVKDQTGKEFQLEYGKGAGQQLAELGCASGLITVTESTVYGDSTTYDAWFIRPEHNACELKIDYYLDDARYNLTLDMNSDKEVITADVFMFESIADALDGYSFISIVKDGDTLDQKILLVTDVEKLYLREKGSYLCTLVNRAGATFSFTVELRKDLDISISFSGEGTSHLGSISTYYSDEGVELPKIERYGYILKGYTDKYGNVYNGIIAKIMFKADTVLEPIWEAKRFILSFDSGVPSMEVAFGEEYTLPIPDSSRPDFGFVAWTDGEKRIEDNKFILCSESDVTLTAEFERTHSLIRFDSNGGQCVEYAICGLGEAVALPIPTRDGFEFIGWSDSERKNFFYGSVLINSLGEVTLVANWEQIHEPEPQPETDEAEDQNIDKLPEENEGDTDGFKTEENREPVWGTLVNATVSRDISENAPAPELPSDSIMDGESVGLADAPHPAVVAIIAVAGIFGACFIVFKITLLVSGG